MNELAVELVAGLLVALISGAGGFFLRRVLVGEIQVLPSRVREKEQELQATYSHLDGEWHQYYLTYDTSVSSDPIWLHGIQQVQVVKKYQIRGFTRLIDHPDSELQYVLHGEIRSGRLIITDSCVQDETEFASIIFPDLRSSTRLIGIWIGFDNNMRLIGAPVVWSRSEINSDEVNETVTRAPMHLVPVGMDYVLYLPDRKARGS